MNDLQKNMQNLNVSIKGEIIKKIREDLKAIVHAINESPNHINLSLIKFRSDLVNNIDPIITEIAIDYLEKHCTKELRSMIKPTDYMLADGYLDFYVNCLLN